MRVLLFCATLLCVLGTSAEAQVRQTFAPGSPIKLEWAAAGREATEGELVSVDQEGITYRLAAVGGTAYRSARAEVLRASFDDVDAMWVDLGASRSHGVRRGMAFGAFLLGGLGAVVGPLIAPEIGYGAGQTAAMLGAGGGLIGAVVGGVIGVRFVPEHRWKEYRFRLR